MSDSDKITYQDIVDTVKWMEENSTSPPVGPIHPNWIKVFEEWEDENGVVRDSNPST